MEASTASHAQRLNPRYEQWNTALAQRFFGPAEEGRPVYLAVDDEALAEIAPAALNESVDPAGGLVRAIRPSFSDSSGYGLYAQFFRARRDWRAGDTSDPPPYLGLLGLSVLAASRMARDEHGQIASHNYYVQYNRLIGRPDHAGRPPGYEELWQLWEDLHRWLEADHRGALGRSTIWRHPRLTHIGYPISQCLLREADRRRLPDFFRAVELEPGEDRSEEELWTLLRNWAHDACGLSSYGVRVIQGATAQVAAAIAGIVRREFDAWEGELLDDHGRHRAEIVIRLQVGRGGRQVRAELVPRRPDRFPMERVVMVGPKRLPLHATAEGWYQPLPLEVDRRVLDRGLSLDLGDCSLAYEPSPVIPFRASFELGGWTSVRQATAIEEHCVLVHARLLDQVRGFLRDYADNERWRLASDNETLPGGWRLITGVRFVRPARHVPAELRRLAPRYLTATRLEGGLQTAPRQYLTSGEPDLWITVADGDRAEITLDGESQTLGGGVQKIELSRLGIEAGQHVLGAPGTERHFATFPGYPTAQTAGTGSLGHVLQRGTTYRPSAPIAQPVERPDPPRGTVYVRGARPEAAGDELLGGEAPPVLLPSRFDRYVILGARPGQLAETSCPEEPGWLVRLGLAGCWQFFDHPVPFEAHWLLLDGALGRQLRALRMPPLRPGDDAGYGQDQVERWCDAIISTHDAGVDPPAAHPDVWFAYVERARESRFPP